MCLPYLFFNFVLLCEISGKKYPYTMLGLHFKQHKTSHFYWHNPGMLFRNLCDHKIKRIFEIAWTLFEIILFIHLDKHLDRARGTLWINVIKKLLFTTSFGQKIHFHGGVKKCHFGNFGIVQCFECVSRNGLCFGHLECDPSIVIMLHVLYQSPTWNCFFLLLQLAKHLQLAKNMQVNKESWLKFFLKSKKEWNCLVFIYI